MNFKSAAFAFGLSFLIAFVLFKVFIPVLRRVKLGQKILEIGPTWHKNKEGTPLMGGLMFITATLVTVAVAGVAGAFDGVGLFFPINLVFAMLNAAIGFVDDYVKLFKKRNRGLGVKQKLFLQFSITGLYLAALRWTDCITTEVALPFAGKTVDLGSFYYVIVIILAVYMINCANLTDGLDGLAGSVAFVISVLFFIIGSKEGLADLYLPQAALCGSLLAFLVFNFYPAKIFMGDTGSLFLGVMLVTGAMRIGNFWLVGLIGLVYLLEGVSDIIQVGVYKLTRGKKRFFKMAPIHHHLELCGFSEVAIVAIFLGVTALACAASYYIYYIYFYA